MEVKNEQKFQKDRYHRPFGNPFCCVHHKRRFRVDAGGIFPSCPR